MAGFSLMQGVLRRSILGRWGLYYDFRLLRDNNPLGGDPGGLTAVRSVMQSLFWYIWMPLHIIYGPICPTAHDHVILYQLRGRGAHWIAIV